MGATLRELAALVGGRVVGDESTTIERARAITEAGAGDLTFLADERYLKALAMSPASAVLVASDFSLPDEAERPATMSFIVVDDPRAAFMVLLDRLRAAAADRWVGVHPTAIVSPTAKLGKDVAIHAYAIVADDAEIGDGCTVGRRLPDRPAEQARPRGDAARERGPL